EKYAKLEAERYEYMIRYSAYFDNDKQHRKQIANQQVLYDKMSVQLVELDKHVKDLKNTVLEKDFKISELEECVRNKGLEIEKCLERLNVCEEKLHKMGQINQTVHMIMPSKDKLYNGRKGIGFENPSYFEKAKDLRPTLYDEKKFKRLRENKIEFAYDYGNLNASYVNEKINLEDDYFQEIINPDFDKIDSPFQQTSLLKPYVPNVILEKIIIDLEDEVINLLEKEKVNLETIESLKSKGVKSSETVISESKSQSENDCLVVEKECDKKENSKVIAPGMFKLNVSQCVSPISLSKSSCDSNNIEIKLKRKRRKRKSSKQNVKQVDNDVSRANNDFVHFLDLDTFSSIRRPNNSGVIWKKKGSSNTSNVGLSVVIAPGMFKLNVSQCVSPISMSKSSCDSNNVEIKLKRKTRKKKSSKQNVKQVESDVSRANNDFVHFSDLDIFGSVRRPKNSGVIWKKKGSSNTSNVGLSAVSVPNLYKNVKRYSSKDLLACNNSHLGETRSVFICNDAINVSCDSRMNDLLDDNNFFIFDDVNQGKTLLHDSRMNDFLDDNNFFIFDDESVKISPVGKMPFRKKHHDSMNNGDQPLPRVTQVSIAGTTSTEQPPLKDKSMWSDQEKRVQKIDRMTRSLLIQGLPNDIYSLIDSNKTAKDLWDALARYMLGSEYDEQDRKAAVLYEYETFKANEGELLLDTYIRYLQVINDLKKCGYSKDNYVNDAMGSKKKTVVVTSDPLALIAEKTNVSRSKEKVVVSSDSEGSEADDFSELKKITALLAKAFNRRKFYSKPTNNNLRTSSTSQSANKKQEFVKSDDKKVEKEADEKKRDMSR
nr:hypothetical protein [Tanacetum cinerariifolium]